MNFREMLLSKMMMGGTPGGSGGSGGGDAGGSTNTAYGTFTIAEYPGTTTYEIEHGLGKRPKMFAVFTIEGKTNSSDKDTLAYVSCVYTGSIYQSSCSGRIVYGKINATTTTINFRDTMNNALHENYGIYSNEEKIILDMTEAGIRLTNAKKYFWLAMSEEALA